MSNSPTKILLIEDNDTLRDSLIHMINDSFKEKIDKSIILLAPDRPSQIDEEIHKCEPEIENLKIICDFDLSYWRKKQRKITIFNNHIRNGMDLSNVLLKQFTKLSDIILYSSRHHLNNALKPLDKNIQNRIILSEEKRNNLEDLLPVLKEYIQEVEKKNINDGYSNFTINKKEMSFKVSTKIKSIQPDVIKAIFFEMCNPNNLDFNLSYNCGDVTFESSNVRLDKISDFQFYINSYNSNGITFLKSFEMNGKHINYDLRTENIFADYRKYLSEYPKMKIYIEPFFAQNLFELGLSMGFKNFFNKINHEISDNERYLILSLQCLLFKHLSNKYKRNPKKFHIEFVTHINNCDLKLIEYFRGKVTKVNESEKTVNVTLESYNPFNNKILGDLSFDKFHYYQSPKEYLEFELIIYTYRSEENTILLPAISIN